MRAVKGGLRSQTTRQAKREMVLWVMGVSSPSWPPAIVSVTTKSMGLSKSSFLPQFPLLSCVTICSALFEDTWTRNRILHHHRVVPGQRVGDAVLAFTVHRLEESNRLITDTPCYSQTPTDVEDFLDSVPVVCRREVSGEPFGVSVRGFNS
ncbi:hypothetical protein EYF80_047582 [Liparis tanakae]|uniref:Uncharacterized protein n=1 Tax=Liparis tanakae TaxID=230148 RepID=A0A4Z2FPJ0_9TELE|nr:hypothetical protein EYF80_047582 [Liparis tanakae]